MKFRTAFRGPSLTRVGLFAVFVSATCAACATSIEIPSRYAVYESGDGVSAIIIDNRLQRVSTVSRAELGNLNHALRDSRDTFYISVCDGARWRCIRLGENVFAVPVEDPLPTSWAFEGYQYEVQSMSEAGYNILARHAGGQRLDFTYDPASGMTSFLITSPEHGAGVRHSLSSRTGMLAEVRR